MASLILFVLRIKAVQGAGGQAKVCCAPLRAEDGVEERVGGFSILRRRRGGEGEDVAQDGERRQAAECGLHQRRPLLLQDLDAAHVILPAATRGRLVSVGLLPLLVCPRVSCFAAC